MRESLFSPLWHHVSELRPRLRAGVRVQRQTYRDETWYLLLDEANGRQHRINAPSYEFIGRFDGRATVNRLWSLLLAKFGDRAPGQDEIVRTLQRLAEGELMQLDDAADIAGLFRRRAERARRRRPLVNPLAFSMPLFDPSRLLAPLDAIGRRLFRPWTLLAWVLLALAGTLAAAMHWGELREHAVTHMGTGRYLLLAWVSYPFVKLLHELAHGLAVRRWGGAVHEFGITFLVLTPTPYMDASAAAAFRDRWQRLMVSAAGILVELALAAAAVLVWLAVQPGLVRDVAFVLVFVCLASSLLFNGNPLLRFDGYHVLCDLLETPNLATRSHAYWVHLLRRLLGADAPAPAMGRGERKWMLAYSPLSWGYRLTISTALVLWLAERSAALGWLGAALLAAYVVVRPAFATAKAVWQSLPAGTPRRRAGLGIGVTAGLLSVAFLALPVPSTVTAQGVVWAPEQATVRAETDGFVAEVLAHDGQTIEAGTPLVVLAEPGLLAERDMLRSRLLGLRARQYDAILRDPSQARNVIEELKSVSTELERVEQRIDRWTVRSKTAGRLVLPHAEDLPGSYVPKGGTLAYVLEASPAVVRAVVSEDNAPLVRGRTAGIEVRLAEAGTSVAARLLREVPAATRVLPSAALGEPAGGSLAVDPADPKRVRALEPMFLFDVSLERRVAERLGQRAWVRFDLGAEPLALQWHRRVRQMLLKHFNPVT
jgi:putative peptide zinc metalloprotease protein